MGDIKLFRIDKNKANEIGLTDITLEKHIQDIIEKNLESFFNIRFIKSEHFTGKKHKGRIDTLGLDENNSPVIFEYKRHSKENVINQGLYYLDWLMDHKAEFEKLAKENLGRDVEVEWTSPRLLCIAGDFTKYDAYAIEQIDRNIELIRFRRYDDGLMLFELVNVTESETPALKRPPGKSKSTNLKHRLKVAEKTIKYAFYKLDAHIQTLGEDVQRKELKHYIAYRRLRNFACVEVHKKHMLIYLNLNPKTLSELPTIARDMSNINHFGTGDLELRITKEIDVPLARSYIELAYARS